VKWTVLSALALVSISLVSMTGCAAPAAEEGESLGESEDRLLAGRRLSEQEVATVLRNAGFAENQVPRMVCTAKYESSFYERASNTNRNGSTDRGLFQINSIHVGGTRGCPTNSEALWNPTTNAKCALAIYKSQGINAWYGYRKHKTECDSYTVRGGTPAPNNGGNDPDDDDTPTPTPPTTPTDPDQEAGGCWSGTLQDFVGPRTCVESKFDGILYQCMEGKWYRGVSNGAGRFGECTETHFLP
jgi:hypothetical protein